MLIAIRLEPVTKPIRDAARAEIRRMIADLEAVGINVHTISKMTHRQFNTVKNWKRSGRIEKCDGDMLKLMHDHYCKKLSTPIPQAQN